MRSVLLSRVVEIVSSGAVVLGLVFVGLELRHANRLAESESVNSLNGMIVELNMSKYAAPASKNLWADYYSGGLEAGTGLAPSDREILVNNFFSWMTLYEAAWKYHDTGILGDEEFVGYIEGACDELSLGEFNREVWAESKRLFTPGYVDQVETTCAALFRGE